MPPEPALPITRVFISYSWDSDEHKGWVRKLADALEEIHELHVVWDGYDLDSLSDKNRFMESGIHESDYVIVIATNVYKSKADSRQGGVGIESYLATAVHWDGLQKNNKTKVILVLREPNAVPNYLVGHLYIDFTKDSDYPEAVEKLLSYFRATSTLPRPPKRKFLSSDEHLYTFTKVEDLIRVGYTNRRAIVDSAAGTDFSGANRIKYEIWETKSPTVGYFLALANNINIAQTVSHAIGKLRSEKIRPTDITVLRPRAGRTEQALIGSLFAAAGYVTKVHEYTYKDYIWEFCIDDSLKGTDAPSEVANYTDQSLNTTSEEGAQTIAPSALDFVLDLLQKHSPASAHLIVAPGGMGKTSLCLSVAAKLHNRNDLHSSVILIQAEAVKKFVADQGLIAARIDSIYQLYELYARHHRFDHTFDRATFELSVLCGNLIVIIDGLDEFVSLFPESFNLDSFLGSLRQSHQELGSSAVLLTTRNSHLIDDSRLDELAIQRHELLGFDSRSCEKYLGRRFKRYTDASGLVARVLHKIEKVRLHDQEGRVVPFFADIAATVVEDGLREDRVEDFEVEDDPTPYPSNNDLTDHIIHSVLRREETRHGLDISVSEVVQLIGGLVVDYGKRWPKIEMQERLSLLYDSRGESLYSKITLNPFLIEAADDIELRYSFLASYFEVVYLLDGLSNQSVEREFIRAIGRLSTEGNEFRELKRYFQDKQDVLRDSIKAIRSRLKNQTLSSDAAKVFERETARKAIASLLNLFAQVRAGSIAHISEDLLDIYGVSRSSEGTSTLEGLFVRGDFPALDFTNLTVVNSRFEGYTRFLASKFNRTKFMYCVFDGCLDPRIRTSTLSERTIDTTCEIGNLREFLALSLSGKRDENKIVESEAKKFLHCFFKGDRFIDNRKMHIKFSNKVPGLADNKFDRLVVASYLSVKRVKEIDTFYEIAESFRASVRRLLTDNYPDASMKRFFAFIRQ